MTPKQEKAWESVLEDALWTIKIRSKYDKEHFFKDELSANDAIEKAKAILAIDMERRELANASLEWSTLVDKLKAYLCRAMGFLERAEDNVSDPESSLNDEIGDFLSSPSPCRHEKDNARLREAVEEHLHRWHTWCDAYPEDIFTPLSKEEIKEYSNIITRNSAAMGRQILKRMKEDLDELRRKAGMEEGK
jgi:hypothetical protein